MQQTLWVRFLTLVLLVGLLPLTGMDSAAQEGESSREHPVELGESANVDEYEISVIDVMPDADELIAKADESNDPPADGYQFFMALVSIAYTGSDTGDPSVDLNFLAVGASNTTYKTFDVGCGSYDNSVLDAPEMFEDGETEINVCWQVKRADVDSLVMYVEPSLNMEDERVWFSLGSEITATPESDPDPGNDTSTVDIRADSSREDPIPLGEWGKVGEYEISVLSITPNADEIVADANQFNEPPEEGNQFFMARIQIRYTGAEPGNPFIDLNPQAVGEKGTGYTTYDNSCGVYDESLFDTPEMFEGDTAEVNVCWQITSEDEESLVMFIEPLIDVDGERVWFSLDED